MLKVPRQGAHLSSGIIQRHTWTECLSSAVTVTKISPPSLSGLLELALPLKHSAITLKRQGQRLSHKYTQLTNSSKIPVIWLFGNHSRSLVAAVVQLLQLIACIQIPNADIGDSVGPRCFLLPRGHKLAVGVDVDALNVVVMAEEEALGGLGVRLRVEQALVKYHAHRPSVVHNLGDGPGVRDQK